MGSIPATLAIFFNNNYNVETYSHLPQSLADTKMTNINLYSEFRHDFSRPLTIEPKKQVTKQFNSSLFLGKTSFKSNQSINTPTYLFKDNSSKDLVTAKLKTNPRRKRRLYWINKTRYFLSKNNLFTISTPGLEVGSQLATTNTIKLLKPSAHKGVNSRFGQSFRNFNQLVDLNYQVYNRVIRFTLTSSRLTNSVSTNSTTFEPQLIAF